MKNQKDNLVKLLEHLLIESDPVVRPTSIIDTMAPEKKDTSLDQAVDRYLVQYERESIPTSEMYETASISKLTNFLFEQEAPTEEEEELPVEEETPVDNTTVDPSTDLGGLDLDLDDAGNDTSTEDAEDENSTPVIQTPKINLEDFARSVARLTNNIQSLIDLKSIIVNRAEKYIQNNYNERTAKELIDILDRSYDLRAVNQGDEHMKNDRFPQPRTAVTGPVGG